MQRKVEILKQVVLKSVSRAYQILYARPLSIIKLTMNIRQWCIHKSYYPELKSKSIFQIYIEQVLQVIKYGYPNSFYFSYGFDVKPLKEIYEYLHVGPFMKLRDKYNLSLHGSTCILRNKFFFGMFCEYLGIGSGENIGLLSDGVIFNPSTKQSVGIDDFCRDNNGDFFIKEIDGQCGKGIFILSLTDDEISLDGQPCDTTFIKASCEGSSYIIQRSVEQHSEMSRLHPQSLNTMRLVTVKNINSGEINILPSILRIGTGNSHVDNTSQGGIAVGIDFVSGRLKAHGYLKPQFGGRIDFHPDTGIRFNEFKIPYLQEAMEQAVFLHSKLPDIHSIGWDIAISPNGPVFIEGNDNWEINGPQICNGPLKHLFTTLLTK